MTVYAIATNIIKNPDMLARYRDQAAAALHQHGGAIMTAGPLAMAIEGAAEDKPDIAAILSFPDSEAMQAWINDPALQDIHDLRRNAGISRIWAFAG